MNRLREKYEKEIVLSLSKELKLGNDLEVPRLSKVVVGVGVGEGAADRGVVEKAAEQLALICGQKPVVRKARQSVAGFKLRKGAPIGLKVTLRGKRMYAFCDRLFNVVLPKLRDFRGVLRKGFDGRGNYSLGLPEQIVFPEVEYGKVDRARGLEVTFVTTARNDGEAEKLLSLLGMPFERKGERGR